jgi:uracil-DNA glycosylase family 4
MSERKHPLANCEECPLYPEPGPVLGSGPVGEVKVAVVGEAPGFHESVSGRPFIGPSGQILDEVLRNNDIKREDVFVTNAVLCRPPQNATPTQEAIDACSPRLMDELARHNPEYILATGAVAAKALGLKGAMQNLRVGPPRWVKIPVSDDEYLDSLVIPTWHPAYTLRLPDALISLDYDVSKINKGAVASEWREPTLTVVDDMETAILACEELYALPGPFSVDIETGIDKDDQDVHADQRPLLCIGVGYELGKVVVFGSNVVNDHTFLDLCLGLVLREKQLIMHNGKSDVAGLMKAMGPVNLRYDTMLEHYTLDERTGGHRLDQVSIELLGVPPWKDMVTPYLAKGRTKNFADIPRHILYRYNAIDCDVTYRLHLILWPRIVEQGRERAHDHMVRAGNQLVYPEMDGIGFDMKYSEELSLDLNHKLHAVEEEMEATIDQPINPRSPQQLLKLFKERGWYIPTEKRKPTTGAKAIEKARVEGRYDSAPQAEEFLDLLFEARDISKDDGTYVRGMQGRAVEQEDGTFRIHTTYTLHVATTGRLSSRDPNLQNIKKNEALRRQFVATEGNTFLSGDYSQVEGRVIAVLSGDKYLGDLFRNTERDIFDEISATMYGRVIKERRTLLKSFFYGLSYGRTAHGIAKDPAFDITLADAEHQLEAFKDLIPGVIEWQEETWQTVQDQGYLETTFGRRRHFPLITNRNKDEVRKEALAFVPQSTASDICLRAFTWMRPELEINYGDEGRIRLTIHDAIVTEVLETRVDEMREDMRYHMEMSGNEWALEQNSDVPFQVAFKQGKSWDQLD